MKLSERDFRDWSVFGAEVVWVNYPRPPKLGRYRMPVLKSSTVTLPYDVEGDRQTCWPRYNKPTRRRRPKPKPR